MTKRNIIIFLLIVLAVLLLWSSIKLQNYFYEIISFFGVSFGENLVFAYYIGWYAVHPAIKGLVPFEKIEHYKNQLSKKLEFEIILMFRMAMPAEIASYALGSLRYDFVRYLLATFITELPFAVLTVYLGDTFLKGQFALFLILLAVVSMIMGTMFYLFRKKIKEN